MLILLSVSHSTTYHHVAFHGYLTINRAIVFHDTPLKGIHIVSTVDIHFQWVTKSYILSRVAIL